MAQAATKDFIGIGRRKTAVARVLMAPGTGRVTINKRPLENYFPTETLRGHALQPLVAVEGMEKYDLRVNVKGGGPNGQAGAVRLGIARALLKVDTAMRPALKTQGLLTRDPRMKERKKYGQPGARKRFQFSKR